ncbi:MAG TPA: FAD-dependent monooxygenase [Longimicrobiales bacterium]|nr:FAD-dependent monooxygenase [Longimicrobiales bacterium]
MPLRQREDELVCVEGQHDGRGSYGDGDADAIIVGGGPAGAITARLLARAGHRVTIVDRARFPRPKACGDCLSAAATDLLRDLGLLDRVLDAHPAMIHGWTLVAPGGGTCRGDFPTGPALALDRHRLDEVLLRSATDAGARLVHGRVEGLEAAEGLGAGESPAAGRRGTAGPGTQPVRLVRVRTRHGTRILRAPLVVGADGLRSTIAREANLIRRKPRLRKVSLSTHGRGPPGRMDRGEMHLLDGGCIGIAPTGQGRFNLTLVVADRHTGELRRRGPAAFVDAWIRRAHGLGHLLDDTELEEPFLASGPFDWPVRSPVGPGVALVGDAAGYFDPFTGQGIYQAMEGARRLAAALAGATDGSPDSAPLVNGRLDRALRRYARDLHRLKRPARRVQRLVDVALARPNRADHVIRLLGSAPVAMNRLLEVTGDLRPPRALFSPGVLSSLCVPFLRRRHDPHR